MDQSHALQEEIVQPQAELPRASHADQCCAEGGGRAAYQATAEDTSLERAEKADSQERPLRQLWRIQYGTRGVGEGRAVGQSYEEHVAEGQFMQGSL